MSLDAIRFLTLAVIFLAPSAAAPILSQLGTLGGSGTIVKSIATDRNGNIYVAGTTLGGITLVNPAQSAPTKADCSAEPSHYFQRCPTIFVAKFDPSGAKLLYASYLGATENYDSAGIAVDALGNAYVAGNQFPPSPFNSPGDKIRAFLTKFDPSGSISYNYLLGASTKAAGVAVGKQGDAVLVGSSFDLNFPSVNAIQPQSPVRSLWVSDDAGATWRGLNNGLPALAVYALVVVPSGTLIAATSNGVYRSTNRGASWQVTLTGPTLQVALDAHAPVVYAGGGDRLFKSNDEGLTWTDLSSTIPSLGPPAPNIGAFAADPVQSGVLWIAQSSPLLPRILKSLDGGASWQVVHNFPALFPPPGTVRSDSLTGPGSILIDPSNSSSVWICCAGQAGVSKSGLFHTADNGATWTESGPDPGTGGVLTPVLDPRHSGNLYASWYNGPEISSDSGQTWKAVNLPARAPNGGYEPGSLAIANTGNLYLVNDAGLILTSLNGGATWKTLPAPWNQRTSILAIDPADPARIYVASNTAGVMPNHAFAAKFDGSGKVLWATLLAGSQYDDARAVAVDDSGNATVAGATNSLDFPVKNALQPHHDTANNSAFDAFVSRISADGTSLLYSTYLGGAGADAANAVAVDADGNAYVAGSTNLTGFPTVNAIQPKENRLGNSFIAKISPTGGALLFSTYLSGSIGFSANDAAKAIAVDGSGSAWVTGVTGVLDFPLINPLQPARTPGLSTYVAKFSPSGIALQFSSFMPGLITAFAVASPERALFANSGTLNRIDFIPPPAEGAPQIYAVYRAADYMLSDVVSPGEIISITGAGLGSKVSIGGLPAQILYSSSNQVNLQVPSAIPPGPAALIVNEIPIRNLTVVPQSVGVFTINGNSQRPVIVHASDYSLVSADHPAHAGEYLTLFCTGLAATDSASSVNVVIDSSLWPVTYAGPAPGLSGVEQINFQLDLRIQPGKHELYMYPTRGTSSNEVLLSSGR